MRRSIGLFVLLFVAAVNADMIVDNFEGYADTAALTAAWVPNTGSAISNESLEGPASAAAGSILNGKFMLLQTNGNGAGFMQTKFQLPGSVWNDHGVNLTYPGFTGIKMSFTIPANQAGQNLPWGNMGGAGGNVFLSMFNCWGIAVFKAVYPGTLPTPGGTGWPNGVVFDMPFSTYTLAGQNLENVYQITVGCENTYWGTGALLVDNVTLVGVPEPATMVILGLGGLLLRKRK